MKYTVIFDKPVTPQKALIVWNWIQGIEEWTISNTIRFCRLSKEIGFKIK